MNNHEKSVWTAAKRIVGLTALLCFVTAGMHAESTPPIKARVPFEKSFAGSIEDQPGVSVVVKFKEGSNVRLRAGKLVQIDDETARFGESAGLREIRFETAELSRLNRNLNRVARGLQVRRLFVRSEEVLAREKQELQPIIGEELADLNLYLTVEASTVEEAAALLNQFNSSDLVETAYVEPSPEPAVAEVDQAPATNDLTAQQGYLDAAPGGVDARYAWTFNGGRGQNVTVVDIEGAWNTTHEDLRDKAFGNIVVGTPLNDTGWNNHGTAVIGEIVGQQNSYGVTGIANGAALKMASFSGIGVAAALDAAAGVLNAGDVILIELHAPGPRYNYKSPYGQKGYIAEEFWSATFDAIRRATARGIIVVEAAGNGSENLDDAIYGDAFNRSVRDSGAILVGAGAPPSGNYGPDRSRLDFSNYGSRLDAQGWGREVFTTGYGDFQGGDPNVWYTKTFSGTSSASPIVTGSVACVQGALKAAGRAPLAPADMRALLANTGAAQEASNSAPVTQKIGPRPNLRAALDSLNLNGGDNGQQGQWTMMSASADSPHPYSNFNSTSHYYQKAGAQAVAIHFSRFETEEDYDFVLVYDRNGKLIDRHTGTKDPFWVWVPGEYIRVVLVSDESVTAYGYHIDQVAYFK